MSIAKSGTLTPNVVETVSIEVTATGAANAVGILNRSESNAIWVRLDGKDPEVEGDDSFPVMNYRLFDARAGFTTVTVKMISDTALDYTVEGTS